jgi:hypothetical protein
MNGLGELLSRGGEVVKTIKRSGLQQLNNALVPVPGGPRQRGPDVHSILRVDVSFSLEQQLSKVIGINYP